MIKQQVLFVFLSLFLILNFSCQEISDQQAGPPNPVILVSPSAFSLESFLNMSAEKIIDVPSLDLTVVYHEGSPDRYRDADRLLKRKSARNVHLVKIKGELNSENLFRQNPCTDAFQKLFNGSNGVLFFGGDDIPPEIFHEKTHLLTNIETPKRHYFELSFLFHLLGGFQDETFVPLLEQNPDYVVLGFCLGMQTLNVATGGKLIQDIPIEVYNLSCVEDILELGPDRLHRNYWKNLVTDPGLSSFSFHRIGFTPGGFFTEELGFSEQEQPLVASSHHQAVENPGKNLKIEAMSLDGKIIEALSHTKYPNVLGVQFHPEQYFLYDSTGNHIRISPRDSILTNEYQILINSNSLEFHLEFWRYFSEVLSK
ncbi:MAG: hypothetical protein EH225_08145 [Calditrichaeota bacterium]|nr:MAG: hypothetical protein EH225_08145 [Calditrichota bacterium]